MAVILMFCFSKCGANMDSNTPLLMLIHENIAIIPEEMEIFILSTMFVLPESKILTDDPSIPSMRGRSDSRARFTNLFR